MKTKSIITLAAIAAGGMLLINKKNGGVGSAFDLHDRNGHVTIYEIFEMRKQGRLADAFYSVLPLYGKYGGHYTTLCYFWTSLDYARQLARSGNKIAAAYIIQHAESVIDKLQDKDGDAHKQLEEVQNLIQVRDV